ncbi:MAG: xanthine dehydrogenase family protein subunit M, partial [Verrucomicrobia bacterium]|nr:xanthine dehydrogenase family protein subunit M [Verrucomicrobiota bacterium]
VALDVDGLKIRDARIAAGGVGTRPWRLPEVAQALIGKRVSQETFEHAVEIATKGARPLSQNGFKVTLLKRTLTRALVHVGGGVA